MDKKPVFLTGASSGGTLSIKLPGVLYVMAKSAGALSADAASELSQTYNGSAAGVGREIAAAALNATTGVGGQRINATAAKLYWQAAGLIQGALPAADSSSQRDAGRAGQGSTDAGVPAPEWTRR